MTKMLAQATATPSTPVAFPEQPKRQGPSLPTVIFFGGFIGIGAWSGPPSAAANDNPPRPNSPAPIVTTPTTPTGGGGVGPVAGPQRQFAGNVEDAIRRAAQSSGLDVGMLRAFAGIESGGNPNARTGSYYGLFQLSQAEFAAFGGKNIFDPYENARVAAEKLKKEAAQFKQKFGRDPTPFEMYLVHQRGLAGYEQHLKSPDALAWTALYNTAEGRQKGEAWARKTITHNLPSAVLQSMGGVDRITNRQFIEWWRGRFEREAGRATGTSRINIPPGIAARGADPNQQGRQGYYSGIVAIGEQMFHYGSGMPGRFSIPYGSYELHIPPIQMGTGSSWGDIGPIGQSIGSVATVNDPGRDTGTIRDPLTGHLAEGIQIHSAFSSQLDHLSSHGCFAISRREWPAFKAALLGMAREQGPLVLNIGHDGLARISPIATASASAPASGGGRPAHAARTARPLQLRPGVHSIFPDPDLHGSGSFGMHH
jgi:hypothetical protein